MLGHEGSRSAALMKQLFEADLRILGQRNSSGNRRGMVASVHPHVFRYALSRLLTLGRRQYMELRAQRPGLPHLRSLQRYIALASNPPGLQKDIIEIMQREAEQRRLKPHQRDLIITVDEMIVKVGVK
jgi:hypothetical protein